MSSSLLANRWVQRIRRGGQSLLLLWVVAGVGHLAGMRLEPGPEQPIPFSHRVHAGDKEISCLFCHPYADRSQKAGMPSVDKCLLCHSVIVTHFPPIQKLRGYGDRQQPVPWQRVNRLADFVFFNHEMHILRGIDCGQCHGDVRGMDRIQPVHPFKMGFCVSCHRTEQASTDCYTCHR